MLADASRVYPLPHGRNDACHFMTGGVGQVYRADLAVLDMDIRYAQAAGTHFDKHLAGAGHRDRLFLNLQGFVITAQHRRAHGIFHCGTSFTHSKETAPAPEWFPGRGRSCQQLLRIDNDLDGAVLLVLKNVNCLLVVFQREGVGDELVALDRAG